MRVSTIKQNNTQNYPSFKMNLSAGEDVMNFYKQRLGSKVNVDSTFSKFKDSFEESTKGFDATAKLIIDEKSMGKPEMVLELADGKLLRAKNQTTWVLANDINPDKYSLSHAIYCLHKIMKDNGQGDQANNMFSELLRKVMTK